MMIIGVTGFLAAGKGEVVNILVEKYGFEKLAYGDAVREEAEIRDIEKTRDKLQKLGDELRRQLGVDFWSRRLYNKIETGKNYVVEGMRYIEDISFFKKNSDFKLIGINAPFELRAMRTMQKKRNRKEDEITSEEFRVADNNDRFGKPGIGQQTQTCFDKSDFFIVNSGTIKELNTSVSEFMDKIK